MITLTYSFSSAPFLCCEAAPKPIAQRPRPLTHKINKSLTSERDRKINISCLRPVNLSLSFSFHAIFFFPVSNHWAELVRARPNDSNYSKARVHLVTYSVKGKWQRPTSSRKMPADWLRHPFFHPNLHLMSHLIKCRAHHRQSSTVIHLRIGNYSEACAALTIYAM